MKVLTKTVHSRQVQLSLQVISNFLPPGGVFISGLLWFSKVN